MTESSAVSASSGVVKATIALLAWFGLSAGIYAILTASVVEGLIWIILTVAASFFLLRASASAKDKSRSIPTALWIFVALYAMLVGATKIYNALITDVKQLGTLQLPELFQAISAVVYSVLLVVFLWRLFKDYKPSPTA